MALRSTPGTSRRAALRVILSLGWLVLLTATAGAESVTRLVSLMGTWFELVVEAPRSDAASAAGEAAVRAAAAAESRLSTWQTESELARLNRSPVGDRIALSPELARDLGEAAGWWRETGGAFHPGLAALVQAWDLRGAGREPSEVELAAARAAIRMELLELDADSARRLDRGFGFEEGGFGKGVALRCAADAALAAGATCVALDLGGQLHLAGSCAVRSVAIADPDSRNRTVATVPLQSGSAASSGNSERAVVVGGRRHGHLLDPRTGRPAPDFGSVTVVAADPVAADCLATALFVLGPEAGLAWAEAHDGVEALFVLRGAGGPRLLMTRGLARLVEPVGGVGKDTVGSAPGPGTHDRHGG